ncbi:cell division protein FtsQ [Jannaschia pagri]|uniref:Cell division protein FtsQ n=1 Tax=Jannaschia pagri TaxID=2829797 RepID=A0ABQ4NGE2_9RHOB|nr:MULTISPECIES: cell division protein FtsQ/DivIB [unclassified Jannaschia]GIT90407.1 cell division protein FtsQ [Jannaschia sp. AI_61]GIT93488.1 cell division protein FtsQ [Jannaschia sp. AI_62]
MRPVKADRRARPTHDPAPSKWDYRLQRLWLTPLFRALVRIGVPSFCSVFLITWYLNDDARQTALVDSWNEMVRAIQDRPEFMVSLMRIEGASDQLREDIQEALPVDLPLSQFVLDLEALRLKLEELDPVERAEVRIRSGGVLLLRITEREPAVAWVSDDGIMVLDATGHHVARLEDITTIGALPLISGEGADRHVQEALRLIEAAGPVVDRLVGLTRVGDRRWDVNLTDGQRILLPEEGPAAALDRALALHAAKDVLSRDVLTVDLRLGDRPTLRLSQDARKELKRLQDLERLSYSKEDE